jgi:dTDP-glucose 4,6-dehydratase
MKALVAGGAGFIGSHLCERLLRDDVDVICIDNFSTGRRGNIAHLLSNPRFSVLDHDIVRPLPVLPQIGSIYHLASPASPPAYQCRPVETLRVNSEGTLNLLQLAAQHGARILYASTSEIYGDPLVHPQGEGYRGNVSCIGARSMYDEAKRYGEALMQAFSQAYGVQTRIVRIFNTYGPRLDPSDGRVVSNLVVQALRGLPMTIYGRGEQTRSFQYVDDLIEGIKRLMNCSYSLPVNLGNPVEFSILEFATMVRELTGTTSTIRFLPLPEDDPKQRRPDITLARELLGWEPEVPLATGLMRTIEHYKRIIDPVQAYPSLQEVPVPIDASITHGFTPTLSFHD